MSAGASSEQGGSGLFNSIKAMVSTLLAIVQTRAELLSVELEEERIRLISMLIWTLITLFCSALGAVFAALLFVIALWDEHRLLAVSIPTVLFLLGAAIAWRVVLLKAKAKPRLFASTLAELGKDRERLASRHER